MLLPTTTRALVHRLARAQVDHRAPSITGAIARGGACVWSHAIESTTDTQYRIGSLTKTFVAVLVMRLRDEGRLDLDDTLETHLGSSAIGHLTLAQLLSHTGGIASETPAPWWERTPGTLRPELADTLGDAPIKHPAGRRFHYSNPGFAALGAVVEKLRGAPWGDALQAEILDPLAMARTSLAPREPHARGLAVHPFADVVLAEEVHDVGRMAPAGQMWSTVTDLCAFAAALAGDADDVLAPDTAAEMRTPHVAPELATWPASYGLGVQTLRQSSGQALRAGDRSLAGHTGSMPGFVCALWVSVDDDVAAVTLTNTTTGVPIGTLSAELLAIVADREPRIPAPWKPAADLDDAVLELAGPWYWGPQPSIVRVRAGRVLELSQLTAAGRSARFRPTADGTWVGENGYFHGETLRPVRDPTGALTHLDIGSFVFARAPYHPEAPIPGGIDPRGWTAGS